jgi:hypothetical protein
VQKRPLLGERRAQLRGPCRFGPCPLVQLIGGGAVDDGARLVSAATVGQEAGETRSSPQMKYSSLLLCRDTFRHTQAMFGFRRVTGRLPFRSSPRSRHNSDTKAPV